MQARYVFELTAEEFGSITVPKDGGNLDFYKIKKNKKIKDQSMDNAPVDGKKPSSEVLKRKMEALVELFDPEFCFTFTDSWKGAGKNSADRTRYGRCQHQKNQPRNEIPRRQKSKDKSKGAHVVRIAKTFMTTPHQNVVFRWDVNCRECRKIPTTALVQEAQGPAEAPQPLAQPQNPAEAAPISANVAVLQQAFHGKDGHAQLATSFDFVVGQLTTHLAAYRNTSPSSPNPMQNFFKSTAKLMNSCSNVLLQSFQTLEMAYDATQPDLPLHRSM